MGLSPDARAPAEEREMRPALRGEGGVRGWGMLCEGQATLLPIHLSLSLSVGLATSTISGPHAGSAPLEAGGKTEMAHLTISAVQVSHIIKISFSNSKPHNHRSYSCNAS